MERRKFRTVLPRLTELENINRVRAENHGLRSQVEWLSDILHVCDEFEPSVRENVDEREVGVSEVIEIGMRLFQRF